MSNMKYLTPKKSVKAIRAEAKMSSAAQAVAETMFINAAMEQTIDDTTVAAYPDLFIEWDEDWRGSAGEIVQHNGALYRCAKEIKNAGQNKEPGSSSAGNWWTPIGSPGEEFPEWVKPRGNRGAYAQGAKVSHNGKKWTSDVAGNKWEPGVKGWSKYTEPMAEEAQEGPSMSPVSPEDAPGV